MRDRFHARADDPGLRAAAAGAHAARRRHGASARRRSQGVARARCPRAVRGAAPARPDRRPARHAPAVQRPLQRHGHRVGRGLQPLARHRRHALARGRDAATTGARSSTFATPKARRPGRPPLNRCSRTGRAARSSSTRTTPSSTGRTPASRRAWTCSCRARTTARCAGCRWSTAGAAPREIELTSYAELVLAAPAADMAHPAFSKLFVQTEYLAELGALIADASHALGGRDARVGRPLAVVDGEVSALDPSTKPTARASWVAAAASRMRPRCWTRGAVQHARAPTLDPIFSLRQRVRIAPGDRPRGLLDPGGVLARGTAAPDRQAPRPRLPSIAQDAGLDAGAGAAAPHRRHGRGGRGFQRLAAPILYADAAFRSTPDGDRAWPRPASGLCGALGISGDLPIVLLRIDDVEDIAQVAPAAAGARVLAHEAARRGPGHPQRARGLLCAGPADRDRDRGAQQPGAAALRRRARARLGLCAACRPHDGAGARAAAIGGARRAARAPRPIAEQLALVRQAPLPSGARRPGAAARRRTCRCAGGPGILQRARRLRPGRHANTSRSWRPARPTPAPWINVIANESFGFQVSAEGSGYTWAGNSRENQLTPWSNDPVRDPAGEALYVRDEASGEALDRHRAADARRGHLHRAPRPRLQPLRAPGPRHRAASCCSTCRWPTR